MIYIESSFRNIVQPNKDFYFSNEMDTKNWHVVYDKIFSEMVNFINSENKKIQDCYLKEETNHKYKGRILLENYQIELIFNKGIMETFINDNSLGRYQIYGMFLNKTNLIVEDIQINLVELKNKIIQLIS